MRIFVIISTVLLVLIIGFLAVGWTKPSFNYTTETEIEAPLEIVWAIYTDVKRAKSWIPGISSVSKLQPGPYKKGDVTEYTFNMDGSDVKMTQTITDLEDKGLFAFEMDGEDLTSISNVVFHRDGTFKTRIITYNEVRPKGAINKSLFYFFKDTFKRQSEEQFKILKRICEERRK